MRIGTWNLAGRWTPAHHGFLSAQECDVWLLTEVNHRVAPDGYSAHVTTHEMVPERSWAGVFSRESLVPLEDPHPASAMATVNGLTFCSSILPWRACGADPPWIGTRHQEKTENAINSLMGNLPRERLVWGGDWNHALTGREYAGSMGGRRAILAAVDDRDLQVPTSGLGHRIDGLLTIDHIALDSATAVMSADRIVAQDLSDHDAYVVEIG